jgi:pimeloyl-ACP methyl ester carboxylesterase
VVSAAHGRAYREGIAGAKLATIPNAGHLPHIEAPAACADIINDFLRTP